MIGLADNAAGFVLKVAAMALLPVPFVGAFLFHPAYGVLADPRDELDHTSASFREQAALRAEDDRRHMMNMGGIMQWVAVGSIALYFMTYGVDFAVLQSRTRQAPAELASWVSARRKAQIDTVAVKGVDDKGVATDDLQG